MAWLLLMDGERHKKSEAAVAAAADEMDGV
jgi:hypothetical protein